MKKKSGGVSLSCGFGGEKGDNLPFSRGINYIIHSPGTTYFPHHCCSVNMSMGKLSKSVLNKLSWKLIENIHLKMFSNLNILQVSLFGILSAFSLCFSIFIECDELGISQKWFLILPWCSAGLASNKIQNIMICGMCASSFWSSNTFRNVLRKKSFIQLWYRSNFFYGSHNDLPPCLVVFSGLGGSARISYPLASVYFTETGRNQFNLSVFQGCFCFLVIPYKSHAGSGQGTI